jgi:hypothetical protein
LVVDGCKGRTRGFLAFGLGCSEVVSAGSLPEARACFVPGSTGISRPVKGVTGEITLARRVVLSVLRLSVSPRARGADLVAFGGAGARENLAGSATRSAWRTRTSVVSIVVPSIAVVLRAEESDK